MNDASRDSPELDRALDVLVKAAHRAPRPATPLELQRGLDGLVTRLTTEGERKTRARRFALLGLHAAVCLSLGFAIAWFFRGHAPSSTAHVPSYRVEGGSVLEGGYLRDSGRAGVKLSFDDGSRVALMPGARGRLRAVDKEGTRVVIDSGTASFEVAKSRDPRWFVEAGPFLIAVKGTQFTVSWEPASERFEVRLRHGSVVVSGPVTSGEIALRAGQRLVVSLPQSEVVIAEDRPEQAPAAPSAESAMPAASVVSVASSARKPEAKPRWAELLASGRWDDILEEVERSGVEAALAKASSEDLLALADAARYRRRGDLARAALLAQRRRFPGSARSTDALFLLGRVDELQGASAQALTRYEDYLSRTPTGSYAAEALGRKMILTHRLRGRAAARAIAEDYLRRFPSGSYVGSARTLVRDR